MAIAIIELTQRKSQDRALIRKLQKMARRSSRAFMAITMAISDAASLILGLWIAVVLRVALALLLPESLLSRPAFSEALSRSVELEYAIALVLLLLLVYAWRGLYPAIAMGPTQEIRRLTISTTMVFLGFTAFMFIFRTSLLYSRLIFAMTWILTLVLVPSARFAVRKLLSRFGWWGEEVAVIQTGKTRFDLVAHLKAHPTVGMRPILAVEVDPGSPISDDSLRRLAGHCRDRLGCALVVSDGSLSEIAQTLDRFRDIFMRVILVDSRQGPRLNWEAAIDMAGVPGLEVRHNLLSGWAQLTKRLMDVLLSTAGLIVCAPVFLLLAAAIKLESPGPVFFHQIRVGKDGQHFGMLKFRTMVKDAEGKLNELLADDPAARQEWERFQKLRDDPRITRVGKVLRRLSLDELPQLWNVFIGEMSMVGPRPYFPEQREAYGDGYENYIRVHPGITGLWQVNGRAESPFSDRAELDEVYVRSWSVWMDIYILAMTPAAVFGRNGAY